MPEPFGVRIEAYDNSLITCRVKYTLSEAATSGEVMITGPDYDNWQAMLSGAELASGEQTKYVTFPQVAAGRYSIHVHVKDDRAISDKTQRTHDMYYGTWYVLSRVMVVGLRFTTDGADGLNPIYLDDQGVKTELPQWKYHVRQEGNEALDGELVRERDQPITHPIHITGQNPRIWVRADLRNLARELDAAHPTPWFRVKLVAYAKRRGTSTVTDLTVYAKDDEVTSPPSPYVIGYIPVEVDHEDYDVFYWALGELPEVVGAWDLTLHWEFEWSDADTGPWLPLGGQDTKHVLYTTVHDPLPMANTDDRRFPWRRVLDVATDWGAASSGVGAAADALTVALYNSGLAYDWPGGQNMYTAVAPNLDQTFLLKSFLDDNAGSWHSVVNCADVANALTIVCRSLGVEVEYVVREGVASNAVPGLFFFNAIKPIGEQWHDAWFPPDSPHNFWGWHQLGTTAGTFSDACLMLDSDSDPEHAEGGMASGYVPCRITESAYVDDFLRLDGAWNDPHTGSESWVAGTGGYCSVT